MTKRQEIEAAANRLSTEVALLRKVLQCLVNDERRHIERFTVDGAHVKLCLYRAAAPDGGLLTVTEWSRGVVAHTAAYYFEEYYKGVLTLRSAPGLAALRCALDRLADKQRQEVAACDR